MRTELIFNTDEQVREYVSKALALLDELYVTDELRCALIVKVIDLYAGKNIVEERFAAPILDGGRR